jgi:hypothetical protein
VKQISTERPKNEVALELAKASYSFLRWRPTCRSFPNVRYGRRVKFVGDIYTMEDFFFNQPKIDCFTALSALRSRKSEQEIEFRAIFVESLKGDINGWYGGCCQWIGI